MSYCSEAMGPENHLLPGGSTYRRLSRLRTACIVVGATSLGAALALTLCPGKGVSR